jgi:hypothetical protein
LGSTAGNASLHQLRQEVPLIEEEKAFLKELKK